MVVKAGGRIVGLVLLEALSSAVVVVSGVLLVNVTGTC